MRAVRVYCALVAIGSTSLSLQLARKQKYGFSIVWIFCLG